MRAPRLEGKVAIVTGAGSRAAGIGNGRAAAVLFAREGARVLLVDVSRAAAGAARRWGRLDILDNNVGIGGRGTVVDVDEADWEHVMRVNVTGMMLASKHAIPAMRRSGGGAIVNISSISALRPPGLPPSS